MSDFASALQDFAGQASRERADIWPVTVTEAGATVRITGAKSPTQASRVQQEQGGGWVQRALATFLFPVTGKFNPAIGAELVIVATSTVDEINTRWRCFDLKRGDPGSGRDHSLSCFRLD